MAGAGYCERDGRGSWSMIRFSSPVPNIVGSILPGMNWFFILGLPNLVRMGLVVPIEPSLLHKAGIYEGVHKKVGVG